MESLNWHDEAGQVQAGTHVSHPGVVQAYLLLHAPCGPVGSPGEKVVPACRSAQPAPLAWAV